MAKTKRASSEEPKTKGRTRKKAKVHTETSVPKEQKMARENGMSYLINDTKVKISVSPKEIWKQHLEDSSITANFIPNTTRAEKTAPFPEIEEHLETSDYVKNLIAHVNKISRVPPGSEDTSSLSDNSQQFKTHHKRDHPSTSNSEEPTNSKNAVDCNFGLDVLLPLKKKKKQTSGIKRQIYDDALDVIEHHTQGRKDEDMNISTESSHTSFVKNKAPEKRLKKRKVSPIKQDLFDIMSPTSSRQVKQLMKDTRSKTGNLNADSEMIKSCDQPKIFESVSSTDSCLNMKPKINMLRKVSRAHGKNPFESLMATCNNIDPIAEEENKTGNNSSGSVSSISPAPVNVGHNFKRTHPTRGVFDSVVDNPVVENSVRNMQPNVNNPCTSEQQSKDISEKMDVLKVPARPKIIGKINNKHLKHNFFESVVENDEQNVEQQHNNIGLAESYAQNKLAASTNESTDISPTKLFLMKMYKKKLGSKLPHTFDLSGMQGHSHNSHHNSRSLEGGRQTNYGDQNSSVNKQTERKFQRSGRRTSEYKRLILPEFGRSTDSPSDSLTVSKFKPKSTSSKICLAKDDITEQHPPDLAALQQRLACNRLNQTHKEKEIDQSDNSIVCHPTSTDHEIDETNYKKRNKYYNSVSDNSLPSSDLTFDPHNVPQSTMVKSSSKKKHPPSAMRKIENKARKSLAQSFLELAHVSTDSAEKINSATENAGIRNNSHTLNGRESENERNGNGMKCSELQTNEHCSNIVDKNTNFYNDISVPEKLYVVSDREPVTESIPTNVSNVLRSVCGTSKLPTSDNDVSQVFRLVSHKTKNLRKCSSINSQEELINAHSKNEEKQLENNKTVHGEPENSSENIVYSKIIKPKSKGGDTKCSVSLPCVGNVSSYSTDKTPEKSYRHAAIEQISQLDPLAQRICNSEAEELNVRKNDKVSSRADRRSSDYSHVAILATKLSETDVLASKNRSNLRSSSRNTGASIENRFDYAGTPNCSEKLCTPKRTPELRERSSPSLSEAHINKTSHKENCYLDIETSNKAKRKKSNKNSVVTHVSNAKIVHSDSPGFSNSNNDERFDDFMKDSVLRNRPTENERGSYTDTQPQMTADDDANGVGGERSVIIGEVRELSPFLSASRVNTSSQKENFSLDTGNSRKVKSKENKSSVVSSRSNRKIVDSDSSGLSIVNNDESPYDGCLKDSVHSNMQTRNERQSFTDNQPQPIIFNDANDTERERPDVIREPLKESRCITHQKKLDVKETRRKQRTRGFLVDGEEYHRPKLIKPKPWINQRFYKHILPTFDRKFGLNGNVKCEEFVKLLCSEVTACIRNRKNWDVQVYRVEKLLSKYLSINTYVHYLIFAEKYLPDEFVLKVGMTYEKYYRNK